MRRLPRNQQKHDTSKETILQYSDEQIMEPLMVYFYFYLLKEDCKMPPFLDITFWQICKRFVNDSKSLALPTEPFQPIFSI
jgi:hypothetical protein